MAIDYGYLKQNGTEDDDDHEMAQNMLQLVHERKGVS